MKTLLLTLGPGDAGIESLAQVPDSALLPGGRPLFLPEGRTAACLELMPAVR